MTNPLILQNSTINSEYPRIDSVNNNIGKVNLMFTFLNS